MRKILSLLVIALCARSPDASAQAADGEAMKAKVLECNAALSTNQELAALSGKVVLSGEGKATLEMQAIAERANAAEKAALSRWMTLRGACYELGLKWFDAVNAPQKLRAIVAQSKDTADANVAALYRGELTFGDFNVKHMALHAEIRKRVDDLVEATNKGSAAAKQDTGNAPAPAQAAARPNPEADKSQCEMDAARAYPVLLVQRMTDPGFQVPGQQRPVQTNCTSIGGQVVCRSAATDLDASIFNRPPTYVTEDANLERRVSAFRSCMTGKGYRFN